MTLGSIDTSCGPAQFPGPRRGCSSGGIWHAGAAAGGGGGGGGGALLALGMAVIERFDVVLNVADVPAESMLIAKRVLGLDLSSAASESVYRMTRGFTTASRHARWLGQQVEGAPLASFWEANRCDAALVEHANSKIRRLAAQVEVPVGRVP